MKWGSVGKIIFPQANLLESYHYKESSHLLQERKEKCPWTSWHLIYQPVKHYPIKLKGLTR